VIRAALLGGLVIVAAALPAAAQTAISAAGNVGTAALRNGYPAGAGAAALPSLPQPVAVVNTAGTAATTAANTTAGGPGWSGGGGGPSGGGGPGGVGGSGGGGAGAVTGAGRSGGSSGGANWVLCPPSGSSGLAPLFTGTDLSCAPN